MNKFFNYVLCVAALLFIVGCANYSPNTPYSSQGTQPKSENLVVPPGLSAPETNSNYKIINEANQEKPKYLLSNIKGLRIEQGGSQRWLVVESKTVDDIWPMMNDFISKLGLTIKYQNKNIGVLQTDWATRNTNVAQTDVRAFFSWVGWGDMYTMPTQYMFRITLWQNGGNVQIFVTDIQMIEVYPGCRNILNSTQETSDKQITTWMPLPPNPQFELEFLMQFMASTGVTPEQLKVVRKIINTESGTVYESAMVNGVLVIKDQFDRAWWRTALALDRVGLGVADKDRTAGEYYVYSLQSQVNAPEDGFFSKLFGAGTGTNLQMPKAQYIVKLSPNGTNTNLTIKTINNDPDVKEQQAIKKYLDELAKQLY